MRGVVGDDRAGGDQRAYPQRQVFAERFEDQEGPDQDENDVAWAEEIHHDTISL